VEAEARACEALGGVFDTVLFLTPLARKYYYDSVVGKCRLTVSNPVLKAPTVSALETRIS
jgi:hypothetical protein